MVDTLQDIGPDTLVDDIVDHVQEAVNEDIDIVQDIENADDAFQAGVAIASTPANTIEVVGDLVIDTAQEHVNVAIDNAQGGSDTFLDDVIDTAQEHANDGVDTAQDLDSIAGEAIDNVQEHANNLVDDSQNIIGDTVVDDVIDTVQEHANTVVDTTQQITGLTADGLTADDLGDNDNAWTDATNAKRALHGACPVVWNQDLADGIQAWVDSLTSLVHATGIGVGENLIWGSAGFTSEEQIVDRWYNEVDDCQQLPGCGDNDVDDYMVVGHFTTVVWKDVKSIGCAISSDGFFAGCRYDTEGQCGPNCQGRYAANVGDFGEEC